MIKNKPVTDRKYFNTEDELVKLFCLVMTCNASKKDEHGEYISRDYLLEKIGRLNQRISISLDAKGQAIFELLAEDYRPGLFNFTYEEIIDFFKSTYSKLELTRKYLKHLCVEDLEQLILKFRKEYPHVECLENLYKEALQSFDKNLCQEKEYE